jgi:hypothetical protein
MSEQIAKYEVSEQSTGFLVPAASLSVALQRYQAMKEFIDKILHDKVDYGIIPGTDKPTLLKPGAEKLCSFFGLAPVFQTMQSVQDWTGVEHGDEPFFYFLYKCVLFHGDRKVGEGDGSANSWEKKHRYRSSELKCPACGKETIIKGREEYGGGWVCFAKKGGCGAKYADKDPQIIGQERGMVKNPDSADLVNTLQKMAQKRALIAATLIATNASEYFTQDVEDFIDGQFKDAAEPVNGNQTKTSPKTNPKPVQKQATRPLGPEKLRDMLVKKAEGYKDALATVADRTDLKKVLDSLFHDRTDFVVDWLTGYVNIESMSHGMVHAMIDWLGNEKQDGVLVPSEYAVQETKMILDVIYVIDSNDADLINEVGINN